MEFDPARVPFSRFGSYLAISWLPENENRAAGIYLRTMHGDALCREICKIDLLYDNYPLDIRMHATPALLRFESNAGCAELCFADAQTLRLRAERVALRLTFFPQEYDHAVRHPHGWEINSFSSRMRLALVAISGDLQVHAPMVEGRVQQLMVESVLRAGAQSEFFICEFQSAWPDIAVVGKFSEAIAITSADFQQWLEMTPDVPDRYAPARELAAYVQWSAVVSAADNFRRPAMLMSKNWLTQVWSWDHCFNAMALVYRNPALAWDQFMLPFAQQNVDGALPDCISDKSITWNFTKPPIHGWALSWMLQRTQFIDNDRLLAVYAPLGRWTEWWLRCRDDNGNGIAQYNHGNDSGWDNCTLFDAGTPLESPDLSVFLVLQMETLADIAQRLQLLEGAREWRQRAQQLLEKMFKYFWRDAGFVAIDSGDGSQRKTETLLLLLPLLLGKRLPPALRAVLLARLQKTDFLTAHGLASESTQSNRYRADGYWRGPIWAPAVLLIVTGLIDLGEQALAHEISRRFCATVVQNGMAENFDALSGVGLRDRAHTWTASVFLILAHQETITES